MELARHVYGRGEVSYGDGNSGPHEAGWLALETSKTTNMLDFTPRWALGEAVTRTLEWYRDLESGKKAGDLCHRDIDIFSERK